jgi:hypothetical protein
MMNASGFLKSILVLVVAATSLLATAARPSERPLQSAPQASSETQSLSLEQLKGMLDGFGYEVQTLDSADKKTKVYRCVWKEEGWTFVVDCSLSTDGTMVWLTMLLKEVEEDKLTKERLLALLLRNDRSTGPYFGYDKDRKRLYLYCPSDASAISAKLLRLKFDRLKTMAKASQDDWDPAKWGG